MEREASVKQKRPTLLLPLKREWSRIAMGKRTWQFQKGNKSKGKEGCFRVGVQGASASQALVGSVLIYAGGQRTDNER